MSKKTICRLGKRLNPNGTNKKEPWDEKTTDTQETPVNKLSKKENSGTEKKC